MKMGFKIGWDLNRCIERQVMPLPLMCLNARMTFLTCAFGGVADQVDKAPASALPHANLQSSESERASAKCYCPLL